MAKSRAGRIVKSKSQIEREIGDVVAVVGGKRSIASKRSVVYEPQMSYDRWSYELGQAAGRHGSSVAYGPETHDAWRSGASPDAYARSLKSARSVILPSRRDDRERVDIEWFITRNGNERAGGWLPRYSIDGKDRGDQWATRGHDRADAEKMARAEAEEEAFKYVGDWAVTVRKRS